MSHRRLDGTASKPEQLSQVSSCPTWSIRKWHSCLRWGSSLSSFWMKRRSFRSFRTSCWVRTKSKRDSHGVLTRSLGKGAQGTSANKESPKICFTSKSGAEVRLWVFPGLARDLQGSSAHFRETSVDWKGQVTSHIPTLGTFLTWAFLVSFPELEWSSRHSVLSRGPYYLGLFLAWPLGSQAGYFSLPNESGYGECYC